MMPRLDAAVASVLAATKMIDCTHTELVLQNRHSDAVLQNLQSDTVLHSFMKNAVQCNRDILL